MDRVQEILLRVVGAALFGGETPIVNKCDIVQLLNESQKQAVFPLTFSALDEQLKNNVTVEQYNSFSEMFLIHGISNARNFAEHGELHEIMEDNNIPYVAMKGIASAMYYPDPSLRNMGDVDFLVDICDVDRAGKVLEEADFSVDYEDKDDWIHIAFHRPPMSIWELHRTPNGIPSGAVGEYIKFEIDRTIDTAQTVTVDGATCRAPDKFHHGLIMLLHTASHLTSEGVGLRHLCDWVVFASSLSDAEFRELFEKKLKEFGLWCFAQALTILGIWYLGAPKRIWALEAVEKCELSDEILSGLMEDILGGGNFGMKDMNRYREIKYISNRGEHTVNSNGILRQSFKTMNRKVYADHKIIEKYKILLPIGYIAEAGKYIGLLLDGKRKSAGTMEMLKEAAKRKKIYAKLQLFE